jgi:hypothetical protein
VEQLTALVQTVIEDRRTGGQLDHTDLTTRDLKMISDVFSSTMRGFYHPRILYPKFETPTVPSASVQEKAGAAAVQGEDKIADPEKRPDASQKAGQGRAAGLVPRAGSRAKPEAPGPDPISQPDPSSPTA